MAAIATRVGDAVDAYVRNNVSTLKAGARVVEAVVRDESSKEPAVLAVLADPVVLAVLADPVVLADPAVPMPKVDPELRRTKKRCDVPLTLPFILQSSSGAPMVCTKEIGRGGHSRCYRLRAASGNLYALKAIPRVNVSAKTARSRLALEIKIQSQLRHPGIVALLETHCVSAHWLLVLEHCANGSMNDWLRKHRRIPEAPACEVLVRVFDAVRYLHANLIFHGDLKLSNILLDAAMVPKLCDFGFAKQLASSQERLHSPYGTPSYMAPEIVIAPQSFGLEADVWSLGVIMYALLFGVTPFDGSSTEEVYQRIASVDLRFPEHPTVSCMARDLIERILDADPRRRPAAGELAWHEWSQQHMKAPSERARTAAHAPRVRSMLERLHAHAPRDTAGLKRRIKMLCGRAQN